MVMIMRCYLESVLSNLIAYSIHLQFGRNERLWGELLHSVWELGPLGSRSRAIGVLQMNTVGVLQLLNFRRNIFV